MMRTEGAVTKEEVFAMDRAEVSGRANVQLAIRELAEATGRHPQLLVMQTQSGIRIYSLADPRNPVEMSFTPTSSINAIAADGDSAFLAVPGSVQRMDLGDPAHPALFATTMQPLSPMQVSTAKGKVVIADRYSLRVYGPNTAPPSPPPPSRRRAAGR